MTDKTEAQPEALRLAAEFEDCIRIDAIPSINDVKKSAAELRRLHAEIQQLKAEQKELREEQRLCMLEASGLANSMFKKHFSHERQYASGEVVWGLCDNLRGVISQIDNMASGLVRPEAQLSVQQAALVMVVTEAMHEAAVKVLHRANGVDGLPQRMLDAMMSVAPCPDQGANNG